MTFNCTNLVAGVGVSGSIQNLMSSNAVPATVILAWAEDWIYQRCRFREMMTSATGTLDMTKDYADLPTTYRQPRGLWITGAESAKITLKPLEDIERDRQYDSSGVLVVKKPGMWTPFGSKIQFSCTPDKAYTWKLLYYQTLQRLTPSSNETNCLTDKYSRLLISACLMFGYEWRKKMDEANRWVQVAEAEVVNTMIDSDTAFAGQVADMEVQ